ncbi:hypothetical protein M2145_001307 [Lachnospiraceae bacterium PF1-21]
MARYFVEGKVQLKKGDIAVACLTSEGRESMVDNRNHRNLRVKIMSVSILIISLMLVACQKTPSEKVVVDKSEGLPEESVIPVEKNKIAKDLGVPKHWQETLYRNEGFITLEADYEMKIPEIYNTPVYAYEIRTMDQELLEQLCAYFSEGKPLYKSQELTKSELQNEREQIAKGAGNWGYYPEDNRNNALAKIDAQIENAKEQRGERQYIEAKLTAPEPLGTEIIGKPSHNGANRPRNFSWYYDTEKPIGFTARIEKGQVLDPVVRAISYDDEIGSTTAFVYRQGTFIDEKELEQEQALDSAFDHGRGEYLHYLASGLDQADDSAFTSDQAIASAKRVLEELEIEGMAVAECVKAFGSSESESFAGVVDDGSSKSHGYAVYISPKAGDVVGYSLPFAARQGNELSEVTYAPSFRTANIRIIVTEAGVKSFEWEDISRKKDMIAENTKLLHFDKIKEKLADHLLYAQVAKLGGMDSEGYENIYTVNKVQLRAANIEAYNDPEAAWLVPVWVFDVAYVSTYTSAGETETYLSNIETVVLNAIDGGFIRVKM